MAGTLPFLALPRIVGRARDALQHDETEAIVYLRGTITWESALKLKKEIEVLVEAGVQQLDLMISSGGGNADAALMLVDLIEGLAGITTVRTIIDGVAASAATLISVSGHERWIHERGWMMIHLPSIGTSGPFRANAAELSVTMANMLFTVNQMKDIYRKNLYDKKKEELKNPNENAAQINEAIKANATENFGKIEEHLKQDNYIGASDCLKLNLVDHDKLPVRTVDPSENTRKSSAEAAQRENDSQLVWGFVARKPP